jgi:hypothetical protein
MWDRRRDGHVSAVPKLAWRARWRYRVPVAPRTSPRTLVAVVAAAIGVCALAAAVMATPNFAGVGPWVLAGAGASLLVVSVLMLWFLQRRRDQFLW